ncbi:MAG: TMEM143 family protein [Pseudomonadota bacterium]
MVDASAAVPDDGADRPDLSRLRFIPFRRSDLLDLLRTSLEPGGDPAQVEAFEAGVERIREAFADEFHTQRQELKDCYAPLDPDTDTRNLHVLPSTKETDSLSERLAQLLNRANYEALTETDLRRAFRSASLFQISLRVNLKDFEEVLLHCRGARECEETILVLGGLFKRRIRFTSYDRVLLYLRFSERAAAEDPEIPAGRVMIKLFQNVPDADLEMLFPNTRVAMRWSDRLLIGVPAVASGAVLAFTKLGAPLVLLGALLGYWLGANSEPPALDKQGLIVIAAGLGAVVAYIWKQLSNYRTRKARFRQALTRNLYFKLLDNNAGVLLRILDDAEDSECKEAWVALRFLLEAPQGLGENELDERIEAWFAEVCGAQLDFEIDDALRKLDELGLAEKHGDLWRLRGVAVHEEPGQEHPTAAGAAQELVTEQDS